MFWSFPIAHGVLGPYDEIILPVLGLIFAAALILTWFRSRQEEQVQDTQVRNPSENSTPTLKDATLPTEDDDSHFRLD